MAAFRHGDVVVGMEADEIREMSLGSDRALLRTRDDTCVTATVTNLAAGLGRSMYNDKSKHVCINTTTAPPEDAESGAKARLGSILFSASAEGYRLLLFID